MSALMALMADLHREALLREADEERRARLALAAQPGIPGWRRQVASVVGAAGRTLGVVAEWLDPCSQQADRPTLDLAH